jgi:hypothetical protein
VISSQILSYPRLNAELEMVGRLYVFECECEEFKITRILLEIEILIAQLFIFLVPIVTLRKDFLDWLIIWTLYESAQRRGDL